jgi:flagellar capping protein FliD
VTYTRTSNNITDIVSGLTLNLKATTTTAVGLSLTRDTAAIKTKINDLVLAYNDVNNILNEVSNPKSTLETYGATLIGDSVVRQVRTQLREMMLGTSSSPGTNVGAFWQMGLSVDRSGVMSVDTTKLDAALTDNFDDVVTTFTANQNNRSATSPPFSTSAGFSSASVAINGGAAFSLTLTGSNATIGIPIAVGNTTPQGVVDAINATNQGFTAQLVEETSGIEPFKILVMGTTGSSGFTLTAQDADGTALSDLSFSGNGSGIAGDALRKITALLSSTGALLTQSENANNQAEKLKVTLAALQTRMQGVLDRYTRQFSAMESLVGNINSQKASLKSSFDGMMAMYTNK